MDRKWILIATLLAATQASASPVSLASADDRGSSVVVQSGSVSSSDPYVLWSLGVQGTVHTAPQTSREVQFILDLQSATDPRQGPFTLVSPFVGDGTRDSMAFRAGSPDDFAGFAGLIANGIADDLRFF